VTEYRIKLRYLRRKVLHLWCLFAGHWWQYDEDGNNPHCGRCGEAAW
jgi:hypothetical protein